MTCLAVSLNARVSCLNDLDLTAPVVATGLSTPITSATDLASGCPPARQAYRHRRRQDHRGFAHIAHLASTASGELDPSITVTKEDLLVIDVSLIDFHSAKESAAATYKNGLSVPPTMRIRWSRVRPGSLAVDTVDAPGQTTPTTTSP